MMAVEKRKHKTKVLNEEIFNQLMNDDQFSQPEINLNTIMDHYAKCYNHEKASSWFKSHGIKNPSRLIELKILFGFADGSLVKISSDKQKEHLTNLGVLNDNHEIFLNCIIIPVMDESNRVVNIYGIHTETNTIIVLKPDQKDLFNQKASKAYDEVILTEGIIDWLSFIELGFNNVLCINNYDGFTAEHIKILQDNRVKTVIIAFKNNSFSVAGAENIKDVLIMEGFKVKIINPITKTTWNEELINNIEKQTINDLIELAEEFKPEQKDAEGFKVAKNNFGYIFNINEITYKIQGFKEMFTNDFKVSIKAEYKGDRFPDQVNLHVSKSREAFSSKLSQRFNVESKRVEKDLLMILDYLEKQQMKRLTGEKELKQEMTEEEIKLGMEFLKSPDIFEQIVDDMTVLGYAGEEINKLLVYLVGVSRLLPKPLSMFIQSPPSTGKSYLLEILKKLLPPEVVEWITSVSDQAFNYMPEEDFIGKIFMMGEALHNEIIEGYIRQMQSENILSRRVVLKDPKTGEMKSVTLKHIVRLVFMMTSTAMNVNLENLSRCIVVKVKDNKAQTQLVLEMQRSQESWENHLKEKHVIPEIIRKHTAGQRLLKRITIINPYEKYIRFPSTRSIMRRGQMQFLGLIRSSCTLRQMQKATVEKLDHYTLKKELVYECDFADYAMARKLFVEGGLMQGDDDLSASVISLYESIRRYVAQKAKKENLKAEEVSFIQTEVREITELSSIAVRKYIKILVDYEYLQVIGGKRHGTRFCYKIREDKAINEIDISSIIPTVEEIKKLVQSEGEGMMEEEKIN
jgi:hypothetical protein